MNFFFLLKLEANSLSHHHVTQGKPLTVYISTLCSLWYNMVFFFCTIWCRYCDDEYVIRYMDFQITFGTNMGFF